MAFTLPQLQAIDDAIASGELTIKYDGKEITYRSVTELRSAREIILQSLQRSGIVGRQKRTSLAVRSRD